MARAKGKTPKQVAGARGGRATSPAKARAARANGRRGAKHGKKGGRPRRPADVSAFTDLGPPPRGPLERIRWCQDLLTLDLHRMVSTDRGEADKELSRDLRATATVVAKLMPADVTVEALRLLKADGAKLGEDDGPEEEDADDLDAGPTKSIGK